MLIPELSEASARQARDQSPEASLLGLPAMGRGIRQAVFRGIDDDFVEEGTPTGVGDADVGVFCSPLIRNLHKLGIQPSAHSAELRNPGGENCHYESACTKIVERVDLRFDVSARGAVREVTVVEPTGEKEHRFVWFDLWDEPEYGELNEVCDLVFHAEAEQRAGRKAVPSVLASLGAAHAEVPSAFQCGGSITIHLVAKVLRY